MIAGTSSGNLAISFQDTSYAQVENVAKRVIEIGVSADQWHNLGGGPYIGDALEEYRLIKNSQGQWLIDQFRLVKDQISET